MTAKVFVNFPVTDLARATTFYQKLGFQKNDAFSNEVASAMMWDESFWIMLLRHEFYQKFIKDKQIADTKATSSALISFTLPSVEAVKQFGQAAVENGGSAYHLEMGIPEEQMYGLEVQDPDGNMLEPGWMAMDNF